MKIFQAIRAAVTSSPDQLQVKQEIKQLKQTAKLGQMHVADAVLQRMAREDLNSNVKYLLLKRFEKTPFFKDSLKSLREYVVRAGELKKNVQRLEKQVAKQEKVVTKAVKAANSHIAVTREFQNFQPEKVLSASQQAAFEKPRRVFEQAVSEAEIKKADLRNALEKQQDQLAETLDAGFEMALYQPTETARWMTVYLKAELQRKGVIE